MGMSNEQFDSYKNSILRHLEKIQKEFTAEGESETLKNLIDDMRSELKKP